MSRRFIISLALALSCLVAGAQVSDRASGFAGLDSLLTQFYGALEFEPADSKCAEADFLIGSCKDSLTRQHVAVSMFDHYRDSKLMGDEIVAIYVYDKWFASGKTSFEGELSAMDAEVYVKFNRETQLGADAVPVELLKPCGGKMTVPVEGRIAVLFFYDTTCAKCRLEAKLLPDVLKEVGFKMDFFAVYSGQDKKMWKGFRKSFKVKNRNVKVWHLWDPEMESGYQLHYGVYGTPRMYVIEPSGTVIGRRLEVENLKQLLPMMGAVQETYEKYRK